MKKTLLALALGVVASGSAFANNMYINLPNNSYDVGTVLGLPISAGDANTTTGIFNEFGFNQTLATSIYDLSDGSVLGSFYDTNNATELGNLGIPTSGTAMDGVTPLTFALPITAQLDLNSLNPLVPPLGTDSEGFLATWELRTLYRFDGTLSAAGPAYTGGTFDVYFYDKVTNISTLALSGDLMNSQINAANLDLYFDITYAAANFLFIDDGHGNFIDAATLASIVNPMEFVLDTNVNPPIPTANQLLLVADYNNLGPTGAPLPAAIRQTTLDGSITSKIPEPGSLALAGLGLLGLGLSRRRKQAV